uniref:Uncharacterized protein n=1 Tax=Anopheles atroparvus TaxID=41427 RepID=A0AAG5D297_ANOAO
MFTQKRSGGRVTCHGAFQIERLCQGVAAGFVPSRGRSRVPAHNEHRRRRSRRTGSGCSIPHGSQHAAPADGIGFVACGGEGDGVSSGSVAGRIVALKCDHPCPWVSGDNEKRNESGH